MCNIKVIMTSSQQVIYITDNMEWYVIMYVYIVNHMYCEGDYNMMICTGKEVSL